MGIVCQLTAYICVCQDSNYHTTHVAFMGFFQVGSGLFIIDVVN